ncbi:hypothetical protein M436DRAFT_61345 [Aureobasidium namibiae CBS 147.97]|uniref:F-box domain-containing protein n=1 Tax=Aureobasidium namibiae CBS 147.97 TaxID=1043004 RepID=A0A074WSE5_9PEZI
MPGLFSLSNELLIQIFTVCPTVQTAMQLSCVNKQLRSIWLQHTDVIVKGIIQATVPAADIAIEFSMLETRLRNSLDGNEQPPLSLWLPTLMRNAGLCASAKEAADTYVDPPQPWRQTPMTSPASPAHWYFIRRVFLAFDYPQLRDPVHKELLSASEETRERISQFRNFIVGYYNKEESIRQGVPMDLRYPPLNEEDHDMHQDAWHYMDDVISLARGDLVLYPDDLALAIQGYNT